ncbi:MAG TPA: lipopolysaccharide heptosyltransferase II [Methylophilaceae bacterium]|nr:lipopolysaccharide heptosyltransferase II [Methylophilaceae bacterium]
MPARILVLGPAWVGDMVLAQSLFKTLKLQHPECLIDVAAPAWTLPLLERMPEVNEAIALPFRHGQLALLERIRFGKSLRNKGYTQSIILTNSLKSAILPFAAGIPLRTGFVGEFRYGLLNDIRTLDKIKLPRTVDRFVALGLPENTLPETIHEPRLIADNQHALKALQKLGMPVPTIKVLGICPGAEYGEAKRWPAEYYAEVANEALSEGWEVWLCGSDKDVPVTSEINRLCMHRCRDFGGKTNLGEAIDLMSLTTTVVSNDSGLMHVAAALGKSLVAIYGSSDPHHTPPMSAKATVLYLNLECSPCFERVCPLGHLKCLKDIDARQVIKQVHAFTND